MIQRTLLLSVLLALLAGGCKSKPAPEPGFAQKVAAAHNEESWEKHQALAGEMILNFEGRPPLDARFVFEIHGGRVRLQLNDEAKTLLIFDGKEAWVSPASSEFQGARFHLLTWPYFIAAPFKLDDPGAKLEPLGERELGKTKFNTARLTFAPGTGDTPDDWYIVYTNPESNRLEALAYIVTYGKSAQQANDDPHAITYYDFKHIEGVVLPTEWRFWKWNDKIGIHGQPLGQGRIFSLEFVTPKPGTFDKPANARIDKLPK